MIEPELASQFLDWELKRVRAALGEIEEAAHRILSSSSPEEIRQAHRQLFAVGLRLAVGLILQAHG